VGVLSQFLFIRRQTIDIHQFLVFIWPCTLLFQLAHAAGVRSTVLTQLLIVFVSCGLGKERLVSFRLVSLKALQSLLPQLRFRLIDQG